MKKHGFKKIFKFKDALSRLRFIMNILSEFFRSYYLFFLLFLVLINYSFYVFMPTEFLSFIFTETALLLILVIYKGFEEITYRIEEERLLPIDKLLKYYEKYLNRSKSSYGSYKRILSLTSPYNSKIWIPGEVEEIISGRVYFKQVDYTESYRTWVSLLKELIEPYEEEYRRKFHALGWNEFKIRPRKLERRNDNIILYVEPTTYYYSFITNFGCDLVMGKGRTLRRILEPYILSPENNKIIKSLNEVSDYPISNHIGINILVVTRDGDLLLPMRSSYVAVEQNVIGHTIAGSLDWKTFAHLARQNREIVDLEDIIVQEILEEEEVSLLDPSRYKIYPIALTRNLRYLGKPDLQLIGVVDADTSNVLEQTRIGRRYESTKIIKISVADLIDPKNIDKCTLLKLIVEKFTTPLLRKGRIKGTYLRLRKKKAGIEIVEKKTIEITYKNLSSNLLIGLIAYDKAYRHLCESR